MKNVSIKSDAPEEVISELGHLPPMLTKLLFHRGILKKVEADNFLNPEYKPHDPFLMKDMKKAVDRILKAINFPNSTPTCGFDLYFKA
jgi:single-stranded-DNA-specific exonuclease